ncbi:hypothetical protein TNCV_2424271 [Trichonephila clavipes]|nr:hypothetical protein TNCV_2424271 [Trichonephila clavipes]
MPQRPDFSERSLSGQAACGRHPTNGKEAGSPSSTPVFSSEAFDKRTNRVSTDVADKHARYISEIATSKSGEVEKVTNELGDNGAHRCVDYCFCKRTAIISAAKVRHCKRKDCPDALFLCRENGGQQVMFFWHLHVLPPIRGFALFN